MGTIRNANEIRPTGLPIYCSACRNQDPSEQHLDFDACVDRGYGMEGANRIAMDDLILCFHCVKRAGAVAGMLEADQWKAEKESLETRLAAESERAQRATKHNEDLKAALVSKPEEQTVTVDLTIPLEHDFTLERALCACGCGERANPGRRYIQHHQLRKKVAA